MAHSLGTASASMVAGFVPFSGDCVANLVRERAKGGKRRIVFTIGCFSLGRIGLGPVPRHLGSDHAVERFAAGDAKADFQSASA